MTDEELLRFLYAKEKVFLQTNDWANLRTSVDELINGASSAYPDTTPEMVHASLQALRLDGRIMLLPDWSKWGIEEDESDGALVPSRAQWEPAGDVADRPTWKRRQVFMPSNMGGWFVRSRVAESARLLFANRERFGLEAATAHLGYELQARYRPSRTTSTVTTIVGELQRLVAAGELPRATRKDDLVMAVEVVGAALGFQTIAAFQGRAWESVLRSVFGKPRTMDATMITAGVSSGKTFAFLLPALTLLVYRALSGEGRRNRALVIYPRTSLVEDQYHELRDLIKRVNAQLSNYRAGVALAELPALDAGQMLGRSLGLDANSLAETLPAVAQLGVEIVLTTPESLKNRMLDPRAVSTYLRDVEMVVFDEIHLMEGLSGCHGIYFIRRLRQLMRDLRQDAQFEPAWVGASATVAEPIEHCARVLSLDEARVAHVEPAQDELVRFGTFHHLFLHTRVGKPAISALTNGIACVTHTRNDCTAFNHYVDPNAAVLQVRPSTDIPKTLVFVDSLSTIGRLRFTTADNEKTYDPYSSAPPYYTWFYRPAARLRATATEAKAIGVQRLKEVRDWCQKCHHGQPARIDSNALKTPEFTYLRTGASMKDQAKARSTPPGFPEALQRLSGSVGNLDKCPFHEFRLCWWFSQDAGERRRFGSDDIPMDQNRALAYTSKTDEQNVGLHENVNDYFLTSSRKLWEFKGSQARQNAGMPMQDEAVSTLLASPRIEVGVDFTNVRDGVTHKAMRSAASFQQKVGRVGREDGSDSLIVTFLAHRPTDAHFAHQPARLLDPAHLDPIPLKSENPDVLRNHMFAACLEFIGSRRPGAIPTTGHELNIIGTGSDRVPDPWEDKVLGCISFISSNRPSVRSFLLNATLQDSAAAPIADEAIDKLLELLELFVADLAGAYGAGRTAAHWFKENLPPLPTPQFDGVLQDLDSIAQSLRAASVASPSAVHAAINALRQAVEAASPAGSVISAAAADLTRDTTANIAGIPPELISVIFGAIAKAQQVAANLPHLTLKAPLERLRKAHAIIQAFFEQGNPNTRMMEQYYLHDVLTKLLPFRDFYPFGLVRTHFQHVNSRQVRILLPGTDQDSESLSTALYELLPGTWNYRWVRPLKSKCGPIDRLAGTTGEYFANLSNIEGLGHAAFEPTGATLVGSELPADMPPVPHGMTVPILRPIRLRLEWAVNRPEARYDNQLIGDEDESTRIDDMDLKRPCPTLPRAFPATWFRVTTGPGARPVVGAADPASATNTLPHTFPAFGRALFQEVAFSSDVRTDRYVYAIDRSYGSIIESPRIHYRYGAASTPVVLGDTMRKTDGLVFRLNRAFVDGLINDHVAGPNHVRGEITIRALRRFIARFGACGPFQADMIRRVVLMEHLDSGGTLTTLDAAAVRSAFASLTQARYDQIARDLVDGVYAGVDPSEAAKGRARQGVWYAEAWATVQIVQAARMNFSDDFVGDIAKDILVHTLAVTSLDGLSRLVGASDGDLSYFHRPDLYEFYAFDSVDGGNGCSETIERFLQIPPLRRILATQSGSAATLPSADGFMLMEEAFAACPAHCTTRLLVETCRKGVADPSNLVFPKGLVADLQARIRHEYDPITGARTVVEELLRSQPAIFSDWRDLLWLQVLPERFAAQLVASQTCVNLESLRLRTHLCVSGCIECVDNGDQSVYGALASREYVSRNLLDAVRSQVVAQEPQAFLQIAAGTSVGPALQANSGHPVTGSDGHPVTAVVPDRGGPRHVLLTKVLSTISPDLAIAGGSLLAATADGSWRVQIPFLASYRDERPS